MTKQEKTGHRSLAFSQWIRRELKDSSDGLYVGNLDWIFWHWKSRTLLIAEEKTHNTPHISTCFVRLMREVIEPALHQFCNNNGIEFRGFHIIKFEHTSPDDGKIWMDGIEIDKTFLKEYLNGE